LQRKPLGSYSRTIHDLDRLTHIQPCPEPAVSHRRAERSIRCQRSIRCPGVRGISEAILWTNGVTPPHEEQGQQTINDGSPKSGYHDRQRARQPCAAEPVQPLPQVGQRSDHSRRNPHCQRDGGQFVHAGVTPVTGIQPEGIEHRYLDQQCQQGKNQQRLGI